MTTAKRCALAHIIDTLSAAKLTDVLRRIAGPEYLASTCAGVYAIVRCGKRATRQFAKGESWSEALNNAKRKWQWEVMQPSSKKEME